MKRIVVILFLFIANMGFAQGVKYPELRQGDVDDTLTVVTNGVVFDTLPYYPRWQIEDWIDNVSSSSYWTLSNNELYNTYSKTNMNSAYVNGVLQVGLKTLIYGDGNKSVFENDGSNGFYFRSQGYNVMKFDNNGSAVDVRFSDNGVGQSSLFLFSGRQDEYINFLINSYHNYVTTKGNNRHTYWNYNGSSTSNFVQHKGDIIVQSDRLGVKTSSPSYDIHVVGTGKVSGQFHLGEVTTASDDWLLSYNETTADVTKVLKSSISPTDMDEQYLDTFVVVNNKLRASIYGDNKPFSEVDLSPFVGLWKFQQGISGTDNMAYYPHTVVVGDSSNFTFEAIPAYKQDFIINKKSTTNEDVRIYLNTDGSSSKVEMVIDNSSGYPAYIRKNEQYPTISPTQFHKYGSQLTIENNEIAISSDELRIGNDSQNINQESVYIGDTMKIRIPLVDVNGVVNDGSKILGSNNNGVPIWVESSGGEGVFIDTLHNGTNYGHTDLPIHIGSGDITGGYDLEIVNHTAPYDTSTILLESDMTIIDMDAGGYNAYIQNTGYFAPEPFGNWFDDYPATIMYSPLLLTLTGTDVAIGGHDSLGMTVGENIQMYVPLLDSDGDSNDGTQVLGSHANGLTNWVDGSSGGDITVGKVYQWLMTTSSNSYTSLNLTSFSGEGDISYSDVNDEYTVDADGWYSITFTGMCTAGYGYVSIRVDGTLEIETTVDGDDPRLGNQSSSVTIIRELDDGDTIGAEMRKGTSSGTLTLSSGEMSVVKL